MASLGVLKIRYLGFLLYRMSCIKWKWNPPSYFQRKFCVRIDLVPQKLIHTKIHFTLVKKQTQPKYVCAVRLTVICFCFCFSKCESGFSTNKIFINCNFSDNNNNKKLVKYDDNYPALVINHETANEPLIGKNKQWFSLFSMTSDRSEGLGDVCLPYKFPSNSIR